MLQEEYFFHIYFIRMLLKKKKLFKIFKSEPFFLVILHMLVEVGQFVVRIIIMTQFTNRPHASDVNTRISLKMCF